MMFCASEDEEDASETENACIKDNFPTLEIPGSLLSSDLSGCKVRVKKFVEGRRVCILYYLYVGILYWEGNIGLLNKRDDEK